MRSGNPMALATPLSRKCHQGPQAPAIPWSRGFRRHVLRPARALRRSCGLQHDPTGSCDPIDRGCASGDPRSLRRPCGFRRPGWVIFNFRPVPCLRQHPWAFARPYRRPRDPTGCCDPAGAAQLHNDIGEPIHCLRYAVRTCRGDSGGKSCEAGTPALDGLQGWCSLAAGAFDERPNMRRSFRHRSRQRRIT